MAELSHDVRTWLEGVGHAYGKGLAELLEFADGDLARAIPFQNKELVVERPTRILRALTAMVAETEGYEAAVRNLFWSPELRQPSNRKPSQLLFTATCQHLAWGGFSNAEILALVSLTTAGSRKLKLDRIRKRIDEPNARSVMPNELHPERGVPLRRTRDQKPPRKRAAARLRS